MHNLYILEKWPNTVATFLYCKIICTSLLINSPQHLTTYLINVAVFGLIFLNQAPKYVCVSTPEAINN